MTTIDMSQYLDVFLEESREHLSNLKRCLWHLEQEPGNQAALDELLRYAHTLKGMSSTMGFEDLADLAHHMEEMLSDLDEADLQVNPRVTDILSQCMQRIQTIVEGIASGESAGIDNSDLVSLLDAITSSPKEAAALPSAELLLLGEAPPGFELNDYDRAVVEKACQRGLRVWLLKVEVDRGCAMKAVRAFMVFKALETEGEIVKAIPPAEDLEEGKFDDCFYLLYVTRLDTAEVQSRINRISEVRVKVVSEFGRDKYGAGSLPLEAKEEKRDDSPQLAQDAGSAARLERLQPKVRAGTEKLDEMMNLLGELLLYKGRLEQSQLLDKNNELEESLAHLERITAGLHRAVMKARLLPIEQLFNRFPHVVYDLARELGKEIDFIMEGQETELDCTVVEAIGDPIMHLLRNALEHGIETPLERYQAGKPTRGLIRLSARHEGNHVYIEVEDDGQGIARQKILEQATPKGLISDREAEPMASADIFRQLSTAGVSPAAEMRAEGAGPDAVKTQIEAIGGEIAVVSQAGRGTRFTIKLPLAPAMVQALTVAVGEEIYAVPVSSVDETIMISAQDIKTVKNQQVVMLRGKALPLYRLAQLLDVPGEQPRSESTSVVVVDQSGHQAGLVVDALLGRHELVVKSPDKLRTGVTGLTPAIAPGGLKVQLILDVAGLLGSRFKAMAVADDTHPAARQELSVVVFQLGPQEYAVDVANVREIIRPHKVTPLPGTEAYVEGVINLRGDIIPLFNLHTRFKLPAAGSSDEQRIVVFQLDDVKAAIIVDRVSEVLRINTASIEPADRLYQAMNAGHIAGIARLGERLLILLNIYHIFINGNSRPVEYIGVQR
ncbi:MAG: chemotaxis protein CheA [Syntrophomonadaceae bacterium]|nr:chemotaxis protein CheA [Syntrophomonadaceae bacterium]